ncbi:MULTISPECIES: class I SAM-dependent DNA methyltransferase [unclassified Cyanobium]|uniref:type I restriction-modification system subunit M n=1 Tax=unclassified Cyanobium TaxID=2627006 RepID=UPI0020CE0C64|nr:MULTISPECIES: class I SAM-dependent DNA methyltransferase [unclassified Cyanobium]MCP9858867.1 SAM-dependent DNA methyltransferase [Cyanobium sp. Cruz-8H5]MCP9866103.1 SAM-dependent DNA methyltransferase [Cyanobium sp. Cruz-8D1]
MPDQDQLNDFLEALEEVGSPAKNLALREALGWEEPLYEEVKAELVAKGIVKRGQGRSDTLFLAYAEPVVQQATQAKAPRKGKASANGITKDKSLESWIWDAACSIRGAKDAPKYKDYILPLIFTKRLCDVFDDELNRIAAEVGSRQKAFQLVAADHKLVRFYLPLVPDDPEQPVWSVIRMLADKIGEGVTTQMRAIARENPLLQGIIDRVDFNATTHGQRDLEDDRLSNLIEAISTKRLGLGDVEADIIGKSYEYLIRKFAEGSGQSAGEFYTPPEVGSIMSKVLQPGPGMEIYDPCCGSGGLLVKCEIAMEESVRGSNGAAIAPLKLFGQEYVPETWAMANMNMIIHDLEGQIEIGDTFKKPWFKNSAGKLRTFDRVVANPMWNQDMFTEADYDSDEFDRFPPGAGFPGKSSADWGWVQHMHASLNASGRAAVVLDTGAASRGSGNAGTNKEKIVRQWFVEHDLIENVLYLPENLFYNTTAPGIVLFLNKAKPEERKGKVFLVNASQVFEKGDPKNFIPDAGIQRIAGTLIGWQEEEKLSRIVDHAELKKNDFNISPSRYIHTSDAESYRPIAVIVEELKVIEAEARETDKALKVILEKLGV